jgi:hypothetical protein
MNEIQRKSGVRKEWNFWKKKSNFQIQTFGYDFNIWIPKLFQRFDLTDLPLC